MKLVREHRRFLILLALYIAAVIAQSATLPVMEGSDESIHTTYVQRLRDEGRLPERDNVRENSTRQASGQAPLTYWLASLYANALGLPEVGDEALLDHLYTIRNDWLTPPNGWNRRDNLNHYFHGANESAFNQPEIVALSRGLRPLSLVWGLLAVLGAYGAAREVFRREGWALTAAALFALMPTMGQISAYFTNDISAVAFATLATWAALRLLRVGAHPAALLVLGLLLALGALSKVNVLLVAPGVGLALALDTYNRRLPLWRLLVNGLLVGLPLIVLFLPWVVWGWVNYNDPFGLLTHRNPTLSYNTLLSVGEIAALMPEIYLSYWAKFGLAKVYLHPVTYALFSALVVLSLMGWIARARVAGREMARGLKSRHVQQALVLTLIALAAFAGLVRWMQEIAVITGRLMYPAHIAVCIGLTAGLYGLTHSRPFWQRLAQGFTVGVMAAGALVSPVALHQAFAPPPMLARDQLPALRGGVFDFDGTIRLLGYAQENDRIQQGQNWHTVTLCWEVLEAAERPAAFSIKFVRDGVIVADRTSIHGLGHFDSRQWQPGNIFCDAVDVPLDDPDVPDDPLPQPGVVYDMLVILLDAETQAVDWAATMPDGTPVQFPIVGQVTG